MTIESNVRMFSIRIYDPDEPLKYSATAQIGCYGPRGWIWGIHGASFYRDVESIIEHCRAYGLDTLSGYVSSAHARLLRLRLPNMEIAAEPEEVVWGHVLQWVTIHITPAHAVAGE